MPREIKSAAEIRAIVEQRVHAIREVREDRATIRIPEPQRHEEDGDGCNWNMTYFGNATGYMDGIRSGLEITRDEYNLPPK